MSMNRVALIVAGGSGLRFAAEQPKQFLELNGLPILMHTLYAFEKAGITEQILVLPETQIDHWQTLCNRHRFTLPHRIVVGGKNRFESVRNGLKLVPDHALVAIHDGVRPLISPELIRQTYQEAEKFGSAIAVVALKDSIRQKAPEGRSHSVDRAAYVLVQTPQTFISTQIKKAFEQAPDDRFTDDAGVYESLFPEIHLVEGDYRNIKITTPEDLLVAESLMGSGKV